MTITLNGEDFFLDAPLSLYNLLCNLNVYDKVMAAAVNTYIVKKDEWKNYIIKENDNVELLHFVGGG